MCIIIDTCMAGDYIHKKKQLAPIGRYLEGGGKVIIDADLYGEYPTKFRNLIVELSRVGRIVRLNPPPLPRSVSTLLVSNDVHVVRLVRAAKSRVVCTRDDNLIKDLKNGSIVNAPRCKVYKHDGAKRVLDGCCP
jgi:hypothetical protein